MALLLNLCVAVVDIAISLPLTLVSMTMVIRIPTLYALFKRHIQNDDAAQYILMKFNHSIRLDRGHARRHLAVDCALRSVVVLH